MTVEIVGREEELATLLQEFLGSAAIGGRALVLTGEADIGKSPRAAQASPCSACRAG